MVANHPDGVPHPLIAKAVGLLKTQRLLARAAGVAQPQISRALLGKVGVSAKMAVGIDKATGGQVPKHELRPDLFDPPAAPPSPNDERGKQ